jgi:hypothetical protein
MGITSAKKILIFIISIYLFKPLDLIAQTYPENPEQFFQTIKKTMMDGQHKEMKDFMESFEEVWNDPLFQPYQTSTIGFCNELLKKKYLPGTHYKAYLQALIDYHSCKKPKNEFDEWEKGIQWIIRKKSGAFLVNYLEFSSDLFKYNSLLKMSGHIWQTINPVWQIRFENDQIKIDYKNANIYCIGKNDTSLIENTNGILYPLEDKFIGKGGFIYWNRNRIPKQQASAELQHYTIKTKVSEFEADSVWFIHKKYTTEKMLGRLKEKITHKGLDSISDYPKFDSYQKRFVIKNIVDDVDYEGGFSYYGNRFVARGDTSNPAMLKFYRDGKLFIKARAQVFSIQEDKYLGSNTTAFIYIGENDSIFHPSVQFKYLKDIREVSLTRLGEGMSQSPFYDSFHKMQMFFEALIWKMDQNYLRVAMSKGSSVNSAKFRSELYYSEIEFDKTAGLDDKHPLFKLNSFIKDVNKKEKTFKAFDFAKYIKIDITQTRQLLMQFSVEGLVTFDIDRDIATITDRFFHTINSKAKRTDYDVIEFLSQVPQGKDNAKISLIDYRIDIKGVNKVWMSDSQHVEIFPYQAELTVTKGMDFKFNGVIVAGQTAIHGTDFNYLNKEFKFKLGKADKVEFVVKSFRPNGTGVYDTMNVKSVIEDVTGEFLIDHPNNKSGLKSKDFPQYPSLISNKKSFVYYEYPSVEKGVYKKDQFYFMVEPFQKDTMDQFKTSSLFFDGTLISGGIFPDIIEKLSIMEDYSLGFVKRTETEGLPIYGGKGTYRDTIILSHYGLRGAGKLDYLTSQAWSHNFIFYPDSMNTKAYKFGIKKTKGVIETPDVKAKNVYIHWEHAEDIFDIKDKGDAFELFEGQSAMKGKLSLTPLGLKGDGLINQKNANFDSKQFKFKSDEFNSDTMKFVLKNNVPDQDSDTSEVAIRTDNLRGNITYIDRKASLKSNSSQSSVEFPMNKFKAYMEELEWLMDQDKVDMKSDLVDDVGLKGALFVSTDPKMDSLSFVAPNAKFTTTSKTIFCDNVKYIDVADSRIFPSDNKINIRKGGKIDPFVNAEVWVGKTDKTHVLKNANLTVYTGKSYAGSADYTYVDELGKGQVIRFNDVTVNTNFETIANGEIEAISDFNMSPHFGFKGKVNLLGSNEYLTFDGYTKIHHTCKNMKNDWIRFKNEIDPNDIRIPIAKEPENDQQLKVCNGFLFASDSTGLYPSLLSSKIRSTDYDVLNVSGYLVFDKNSQEFRISRQDKLDDPELPGSYLAFNANECTSYGEGQMVLGTKLGQVSMKCAGSINHEPAEDNITMDIVLNMNFKLDPALYKIMEDKIKETTNFGADLTDDKIRKSIVEMLDSAKAEKLFNDMSTEGKFKRIPKELNKTLVLTDINLKWDKAQRSLLHNGPAGILIYRGDQVNKTATALIELNRKSGGDIVTIYLELNETTWFYFYYRNNMMMVYSSIKEFNETMTSLDTKKRSFEEEGQPLYQITPGTAKRVDRFKEKFGIETTK